MKVVEGRGREGRQGWGGGSGGLGLRGKVGEKRKIGITHEREEERVRGLLPSSSKRGDMKKRFALQTRAQEKREKGWRTKKEGKKE